MIILKMYFGEGSLDKHTKKNFREIHNDIKKSLQDSLKGIEKPDMIKLITVDDDAYVTNFEKGEVLVEISSDGKVPTQDINKYTKEAIQEYLSNGSMIVFFHTLITESRKIAALKK